MVPTFAEDAIRGPYGVGRTRPAGPREELRHQNGAPGAAHSGPRRVRGLVRGRLRPSLRSVARHVPLARTPGSPAAPGHPGRQRPRARPVRARALAGRDPQLGHHAGHRIGRRAAARLAGARVSGGVVVHHRVPGTRRPGVEGPPRQGRHDGGAGRRAGRPAGADGTRSRRCAAAGRRAHGLPRRPAHDGGGHAARFVLRRHGGVSRSPGDDPLRSARRRLHRQPGLPHGPRSNARVRRAVRRGGEPAAGAARPGGGLPDRRRGGIVGRRRGAGRRHGIAAVTALSRS